MVATEPKSSASGASLAAIIFEGLLSRLSFGLVTFALPLFAIRLGMSLVEAGFLISLNLIVATALQPVMGRVVDRVGWKRSHLAALGLRTFVTLLLVFATSAWHLYAIRVVHGLAASFRDPAANALISEHGGARIGSAFASYQTAKTVGAQVAGGLAGISLFVTGGDFALVFLIAFGLSAAPIFAVARFVRDVGPEGHPPVAAAAAPKTSGTSRSMRADNAKAWRLAILGFAGWGFLITSSAQMINRLFPILATEYAGLNEAQTGVIYLVGAIFILPAGPVFGWLSDHVSRRLVLLTRGVSNAVSSILLLVAPTFAGFTIGHTADSLGKAAFRPAWGTLMAHVSSHDRRRRAETMSYMVAGENAGEIAGPVVATALWSAWGVPVMLLGRLGLTAVAEVYGVLMGRIPGTKERLAQPERQTQVVEGDASAGK